MRARQRRHDRPAASVATVRVEVVRGGRAGLVAPVLAVAATAATPIGYAGVLPRRAPPPVGTGPGHC